MGREVVKTAESFSALQEQVDRLTYEVWRLRDAMTKAKAMYYQGRNVVAHAILNSALEGE